MSFPEGKNISDVKQMELLFLSIYGACSSNPTTNTNCFHPDPSVGTGMQLIFILMLSHTWLQAACHLTGSVWATANFLPLAFPQELQKHYGSALLLFPNFPL